jgi:hypothetical protein
VKKKSHISTLNLKAPTNGIELLLILYFLYTNKNSPSVLSYVYLHQLFIYVVLYNVKGNYEIFIVTNLVDFVFRGHDPDLPLLRTCNVITPWIYFYFLTKYSLDLCFHKMRV